MIVTSLRNLQDSARTSVRSQGQLKNTGSLDNKAVPGEMTRMKMDDELRGAKGLSLPPESTPVELTGHDRDGACDTTDVTKRLPMTETSGRDAMVRAGVRAEVVTIVWMIVEAVVAVVAGVQARSILVTAFGIDSVIELVSAAVLLWRIKNESSPRAEAIERRAAAISGGLLVLLCLFIATSSVVGILRHIVPDPSSLGLAIAASAVVLMPLLAAWKRHINRELQSAALRADIAETSACGYMAAIVVVGVLLDQFLHVWWIEYAASLVLLLWIAHEAKEAFEGAEGGCADACEK